MEKKLLAAAHLMHVGIGARRVWARHTASASTRKQPNPGDGNSPNEKLVLPNSFIPAPLARSGRGVPAPNTMSFLQQFINALRCTAVVAPL